MKHSSGKYLNDANTYYKCSQYVGMLPSTWNGTGFHVSTQYMYNSYLLKIECQNRSLSKPITEARIGAIAATAARFSFSWYSAAAGAMSTVWLQVRLEFRKWWLLDSKKGSLKWSMEWKLFCYWIFVGTHLWIRILRHLRNLRIIKK